jgi:hypothetical protein
MAGGTWVDQNKVRPGVYINYKSAPASLATMGERGTVAIARVLDWGERGRWYTITDPSDCAQFGHSITDAECLFIRQILLGSNRTQGASKILLWSLEAPTVGTTASFSFKNGQNTDVIVSAKSEGSSGNNIAIAITKSGSNWKWTVYDGNVQVAEQDSLGDIASLSSQIKTYISVNPSAGDAGTTDSSNIPKTFLSGGSDGASKAIAILGNLTATARYVGTFGNRLSVVITSAPESHFIVQTLLDGQAVDSQDVTAISGLVSNDYIDWSGTGALAVNTGVSLAGGTNGEAAISNYNDFFDALETQRFDIVIYDGSDAAIKSAFASLVKDLSDNEGVKCQAVVSDYNNADSECVISVYPQSITLVDGTVLEDEQLTWWVGGCSAGAKPNESLTYAAYPDAVKVNPLLTGQQQKDAIKAGHIVIFNEFGDNKVLTDINSFRTLRVEKGQAFQKNRVVRALFGVCNDIYQAFSKYYIGAVDNDEEGRKSLKAEIINILNRYQGMRAIRDVDVEDVTVLKGAASDAVVIELYIRPVDSVEKIYINITIS